MPVEDEHGNKVKLNINKIKTVDKTDMERIKSSPLTVTATTM